MNKDYIQNLKSTIKEGFVHPKFKQFLGVHKSSSLSNKNIILDIISNESLNIFEDQFEQSIIGNISLTDKFKTSYNEYYVILNVQFNDDFKETFNIDDEFVTLNLSENESFYIDVETIIGELSIIFNDINSNIQSVFDNYQAKHPKEESKYSVATVKNIAKMFGFE